MRSNIDVILEGGVPPALEVVIHRWIARFEEMGLLVDSARVNVARSWRGRTSVALALGPGTGTTASTTAEHKDAHVAIADAFREARRQLLACAHDHERAVA